MRHVVALFGQAEKGQFKIPYYFKELTQLMEHLGECPQESLGLFFAIQALLYNRDVIYVRVEEEGFSKADYIIGSKHLETPDLIQRPKAICLPGVGDPEILQTFRLICEKHQSFLITTQKDLYDYLTSN
jgi:hypothetical protein